MSKSHSTNQYQIPKDDLMARLESLLQQYPTDDIPYQAIEEVLCSYISATRYGLFQNHVAIKKLEDLTRTSTF